MKKLLVAALLTLSASALAQDVTIKLGTLAPQGSSWHTLLKELAEKWSEASGGKVKLKIHAGGTQGSEGDMVRKMGVGQLQAASITNVGVHDIVAEPMVFSTPGMVDENDFKVIFPQVEKKLEALAEAKGYVVLHWAQVGTIRVFAPRPTRPPKN
jgi:TRAP-type C4-dicarboxylate transport system substrate-binding protein